ncbi:hypothetical protein EV363DRAFT_693043 [Boletus edulis]|uniref:Zn(2)-C6 fungal-type domain-containing protein n=1 Tax=Boletus edulis BED1 TaxID=1328754 RepID=A0AAD4BWB0_BOLED|nr:hypothetical protein EV363DRAFT_693043 [Boletus edulis]KAF8441713.1 hypothetical protein L210DRAFT_3399359 [Boletus edulis BED1]
MEGFQFIIESPHEAQSQKKRPRLVTSCDNCRLKKIKCLQPTPESQCEACKVAKTHCRFRDRERYFAERSRAIAGPSVTRPADRTGYSTHDTPSRPGSTVPEFPAPNAPPGSPLPMQRSSSYSPPQPTGYNDGHVRYQSYPLDPAKSPGSHNGHRTTQSCSGILYGTLLFEPGHPPSPQRVWMQQFIQLFISNMGGQCPFLSYDDIYDKFRRQTLPPLLSNCIAALGARFSNIPEVVSRGSQTVAEIYSDMAKEQLSTSLQQPSVETLQATILLAWAEYKSGRGHGFRQYSDLATQTAMAIGLSEESSLQLSPYDPYQNRLRITWSSLSQLRLYASSSMTTVHSHADCR